MRIVSSEEVERALDYPSLVEALAAAFRAEIAAPLRHHHELPVPGEPGATLLLMPAWRAGAALGVKIATVFPGNAARGLPAVQASYLLLDGASGTPRALIDGAALTRRRTAAASALAARYLAREDTRRLLMVGTGALAPELIAAHTAVRPIAEVAVWGRAPERAAALASRLDRPGLSVRFAAELESEARRADLISCATLASQPLVRGAWLAQGAHLDLVGGFTPERREADDGAVQRARVFVDTRAGALAEAGDIVQPLRSGALCEQEIAGDLHDLTRGACRGREGAREITLFKSVGCALEDLAAAELVATRLGC